MNFVIKETFLETADLLKYAKEIFSGKLNVLRIMWTKLEIWGRALQSSDPIFYIPTSYALLKTLMSYFVTNTKISKMLCSIGHVLLIYSDAVLL